MNISRLALNLICGVCAGINEIQELWALDNFMNHLS